MEGREQPGREGVVERRTPGGFVWRAEGTLNTRYFRAPAEPLGRDYWLLLNSFGMQWQQGGYFKVLRGDTDLEMLHYGAWGADFQLSAAERKRFPAIFAVEVSFSPVPERHGLASEPLTELEHVWLRVAFATDEPATSLIRVSGLATGLTAEVAENLTTAKIERLETVDGAERHNTEIDLLRHDLLGDRLELRIWASDHAKNTGDWGPVTFDVPELHVFRAALSDGGLRRRLESGRNGLEALAGTKVLVV
ncbi:Hypothetical protein (Fragment) [Durusdinium trenchii]|uniref:Uncharacterized protein n=1 Tax=Durusdinium trenchii TaxID=1381693 RepID=A0ABP0R8A5_9DINO